jgi:CheY-like chemotaxis protein
MKLIHTVAVIDDDDEAAMTIIHALEDGGFTAYHQAPADNIEDLTVSIIRDSDAAVCDHRLRYGGFADVSGAELAASLISRFHPTILVTQYLDQDADISIRRYRSHLPVVLRRQEADEPDELRMAFERCVLEIEGTTATDRKLHQTLLLVKDVTDVGGIKVIDAIVNGWNPKDTVRFPLLLVNKTDQDQVKPSVTLVADTNIGTEDKVDLYFENIKIAPEPEEDDGLE